MLKLHISHMEVCVNLISSCDVGFSYRKMARGSKDKTLCKLIDSGGYAFDEGGRMYSDCVTTDGWRVNGSGDRIR